MHYTTLKQQIILLDLSAFPPEGCTIERDTAGVCVCVRACVRSENIGENAPVKVCKSKVPVFLIPPCPLPREDWEPRTTVPGLSPTLRECND